MIGRFLIIWVTFVSCTPSYSQLCSFDDMDEALISSGVDIVPREPSWIEFQVRRIADPIVVALSRHYTALMEKSRLFYMHLKAHYSKQYAAVKAYCDRIIR